MNETYERVRAALRRCRVTARRVTSGLRHAAAVRLRALAHRGSGSDYYDCPGHRPTDYRPTNDDDDFPTHEEFQKRYVDEIEAGRRRHPSHHAEW